MFIKINDLKIHYRVSGSGTPVLLLHGWGCNIDYFGRLQVHLAERFKVFLLDLPGFGLSTAPEDVWGSSDYADLVEKFIAALNLGDPILLGHSLGGKVAINMVSRGLVNAKKLILVSSSGIQLPKSSGVKLRIYVFKMLKILASLPLIRSIFAAHLERYKKRFGSSDYKNASGIMRSILVKTVNENVLWLLPKIKIPVLVLWGGQDTTVAVKAAEVIKNAVANAKLKVFPGSGHFPFLDNADEFIVELDRFLN